MKVARPVAGDGKRRLKKLKKADDAEKLEKELFGDVEHEPDAAPDEVRSDLTRMCGFARAV